jgi:hypothetical protein
MQRDADERARSEGRGHHLMPLVVLLLVTLLLIAATLIAL